MKRTPVPSPRRRPKPYLVAVLWVAAAAVLCTALFGAMRLRTNADRHSKAALSLAGLETEALELDRALDTALLSSSPLTPDDARVTAIVGVRRDFEAARAQAIPMLDPRDQAQLDIAAARFAGAADAVAGQLAAGQHPDARATEAVQLEPAFETVHQMVGSLVDRGQAAATSSRRVADRGFLAILVLAGLGIAGLAGAAGIARRRAERFIVEGDAVRRSEARFRALMTNGDDIVMVMDRMGIIREVGDSVIHVLGVAPQAVLGRKVSDLVHPDEAPAADAELARVVATGAAQVAEWRCRDGMGSWRYVEATMTNLIEVPEVGAIVVNVRDVSERRRLEDELRHRAFHDSLTGLANRALLRDRVAHAMAQRRASDASLLVLDLDGFKQLNDSLGHPAGDHALAVVADRLRGASRPGDTVARLGGDEFAILIEEPMARDEVVALAQRLVDAIVEPLSWEDQQLTVGTCVGIAFVEPGLHGPDDLVRNADVALYAAKAVGPGHIRVFESAMHDAVHERFVLATELRHAIDANQLVLHYQPVVELVSGRPVGFEALVRWEHPTHGLLPPDAFIPIAEESGLIVSLGRWVLTEACRAAARWHGYNRALGPLRVSVNLSGRQIQDPDIVGVVADALADAHLDPDQLTLEITETALMHNVQEALARLTSLKELGVHLAVDDFGTGYSSLSYLQQFPVDTVKIDKAFIDGANSGDDDTKFLEAILSLGDALHLHTLAEGIETAGQAETLERLGCRLGQGFHYARPLSSDAVRLFLEGQPAAALAETN